MNDKGTKFRDNLSIANFSNKENDHLSVQNFGKKRVTPEKQRKTYKSNTKLSNKKPNRKLNKKFLGSIAAAGIAGLAIFGGCQIFKDSQLGNNGVTIEEALNNQNTLETLGLDENTAKDIQELKGKIENIDNLSDKEIQDLIVEVEENYFTTVKDKLANIYDADIEDIKIQPEGVVLSESDFYSSSRPEASIIINEEIVAQGDQIPQDLKDYFKECEDARINVNTYVRKADENYDRTKAIKAIKEDMVNIEKMGATEITLNEDGNLETYLVTVQDVDINQKENDEDIDR